MNKVVNMLISIDENIKKIMRLGIKFCFLLIAISCVILITYELFYSSPLFYYVGIYLFKDSFLFLCSFLAFGIVFDKIKKDLY